MVLCCLFSITQKSYGQLSFNSTPVTTATVGTPYTYSSFASDGTSNGPAMTCPTKPAWMSFAANGSSSMQTFGPTINSPVQIMPTGVYQAIDIRQRYILEL